MEPKPLQIDVSSMLKQATELVQEAVKGALSAKKQLEALSKDPRFNGPEFDDVRLKIAAIENSVEAVLVHA